MAGLSDHIRNILSGAPELLSAPGLTVGLAQGANAPQSGPVDSFALGQSAATASYAAGYQQAQADLKASASAPTLIQTSDGEKTPQQIADAFHHQSGGSFNLNPLHDVAKIANDVGSAVGHDVVSPVLHDVVEPTLGALNKPLSFVQHTYRYVHDQWTRYGVMAGINGIVGILGGRPLGASGGIVDKAEGFSPSTKQQLTSWQVTQNGSTYRDIHGNVVNPGYDFANVTDHILHAATFGHLGADSYNPAGWTRDEHGNMVSTDADPNDPYNKQLATAPGATDIFTGAANAVFDLTLDPALAAGKAAKVAQADGVIIGGDKVALSADAATRTRQMESLADGGKAYQIAADGKSALVGGRVLVPGRVPRLLTDYDGNRATNIPSLVSSNPGIRDAFGRLAGMSTKDIVTSYPMLRPLAGELGKAESIDEVSNTFERAMTALNYTFTQKGLPTTSLTRRLLSNAGIEAPTGAAIGSGLADAARNNLGKVGRGINRAVTYRPFTIDSRTLQLSSKEINPDDPAALNAIRSTLLISQDRKTADAILARYIEAPDTGTRLNILTNAFRDTLRAAGVPDDHTLMQQYARDIDFMNKNSLRQVYGVGEDGNPVAALDPETGEPLNFGLFHNQTGKIALPDFNEVRKAVAEGKGKAGWLTRADDWVYNHYTTRIFKNLALLSMGFAFRVASGELVPAILQNGAKETFGSGLMAAAAKVNPTMRGIVDEYGARSLEGVNVRTADGVAGTLKSINGDKAIVGTADGDVEHDLNTLDALHGEVPEETIRTIAAKSGVIVSAEELPHYKAAISKALYGVGRALVDPDYYDTAVRNVLTLDGHMVAPGLTSNHDVMGSGAGPAEDLREALLQAGARTPDKPSHLTDAFRLYDSGDSSHPMFWHFAANEASQDPGVQRGAKAYLDTYRAHLSNPTRFEIEERGNRGQIVVASRSGHVRGSLQFEQEGNALKVGFSSVADEAQGEKVHSAMREALYQHAAERGMDVIHPEVVNENLLKSYSNDKRLYRTSENSFRKPANAADVKDPAKVAAEGAANRAYLQADKDWMVNGEGDLVDQFRTKMALNAQGPDQFSDLRRRAMRGLVYGKNGQLNEDLLAAIAGDRSMPSIAELARKEEGLRPLAVKGREIDPLPKEATLDRITAWGWRRFLHPTINSLSRTPIYTMLTTQEYKAFKPWLEKGLIDPMEAHQIAQVRAANRMLPLIHNTKLRSQMSDTLRNIVPFYFAQEQAYKRYGRVIASDPVAFRRALLGAHGISNSGITRKDENGNASIVMPGSGELAKWMTIGAGALGVPVLGGIPSVISGNTISLRTVVPEGNLPSVSPLVAVPLKEIQNRFPATEPFISKVIGPVNEGESVTDQLIPNASLKRVLQATPILDRESGFQTSYLNAIAYAAHRADDLRAQAAEAAQKGNQARAGSLEKKADAWLPGPNADPFVKQAALDRIKNSTRIMALAKAAIGAVSPLSPTMDVGDVKLREEVQADIAKFGLAQGLQRFLDRNPNATAATVFQSDNSATGTALPATKAAYDWVQQNRSWISSHGLAAAYLIPQTKQAFDVEAYNQELAAGLRAKKSDQQMLSALYTAATDPQYYNSLTDFENQYKAAEGNSYLQQQLSNSWQEYKASLASANPVWAASIGDPNKVAVARQTLYQLQQALTDPNTPDSPQAEIAASLTNSYNDYLSAQNAVRQGQSATSLTALQDSFNNYLDSVVQQTPAASALVTGVFRRLVNAK